MATEIHYQAAQIGQASRRRRLDPPLLMGLDEVTQICPVPLPVWLSRTPAARASRSCAVAHGEAQLAARWGDHGRQVVLDTSRVKVFLPGITDTSTLRTASELCGQAPWQERGEERTTRHEVASPSLIRQLPAGFALVLRGGCAPVIARLPVAWKDPIYKRAHRADQAVAPLTPAAAATQSSRPGSAGAHHPRRGARRPGRRHSLPVELTMTEATLNAALLQLCAHGERLAVLEDREAGHFTALSDRLAEITALAESLGGTLRDQAAILARLQDLDADVAALTGRLGSAAPGRERDGESYQPVPAPRWWKLPDDERAQAMARLHAWVDQVYRPGYGQLAAALGPCWDQHPLCLYGLDILAELWSLLYLQPRTPAALSGQAEFQTRILPAITEQLLVETARCSHAQPRTPVNGHAWRTP